MVRRVQCEDDSLGAEAREPIVPPLVADSTGVQEEAKRAGEGMNGEFVESEGYQDLDGLNIKPPEITLVGSELAHKLIGRNFSEITVSAEQNELVWINVRFAATRDDNRDDIVTLRAMAEQVASEKLPRETGDYGP